MLRKFNEAAQSELGQVFMVASGSLLLGSMIVSGMVLQEKARSDCGAWERFLDDDKQLAKKAIACTLWQSDYEGGLKNIAAIEDPALKRRVEGMMDAFEGSEALFLQAEKGDSKGAIDMLGRVQDTTIKHRVETTLSRDGNVLGPTWVSLYSSARNGYIALQSEAK